MRKFFFPDSTMALSRSEQVIFTGTMVPSVMWDSHCDDLKTLYLDSATSALKHSSCVGIKCVMNVQNQSIVIAS